MKHNFFSGKFIYTLSNEYKLHCCITCREIYLLQLRLLLMITSNLNLKSSVNPLQLSKPAKKFTQVETQK